VCDFGAWSDSTGCCALDVDRKPVKQLRKTVESSDEEGEDEEEDDLDDFIDDGSDVEHTDYSHYIRELFGYDRCKSVMLLLLY